MRKAVVLTIAGTALLLWALGFLHTLYTPQYSTIGCGPTGSRSYAQYGWPVPYKIEQHSSWLVNGKMENASDIFTDFSRMGQCLALWAVLFAAILIASGIALTYRRGMLLRFHLTTAILLLVASGALIGLNVDSDWGTRFRFTKVGYGWPVPTGASQNGLTRPSTPAGRAAEAVVVDAIFSLALLFCLAAASEWLLRRRNGAGRLECGRATP